MKQGAGYYELDMLGNLKVICWCGRHFIDVPAGDVRRGVTRSCGEPDCQPGAVVHAIVSGRPSKKRRPAA